MADASCTRQVLFTRMTALSWRRKGIPCPWTLHAWASTRTSPAVWAWRSSMP